MNVKSVIGSLRGHISTHKVEALLSRPVQQESNRETKKRTVLILVNNGAEPFTGTIGDRIDAIGIDNNVWLIESLNPVVALSAELDSGLIDFPVLATACRKHDCRFIAACGDVDFGIVGSGTRMSYGSVTRLWSLLISAALHFDGSDSWISGELRATTSSGDWAKIELRDVEGTQFYRVG